MKKDVRTYWLLFVFQQTHSVLNHHLILESDEFCDLFGNPWSDDIQINFTQRASTNPLAEKAPARLQPMTMGNSIRRVLKAS